MRTQKSVGFVIFKKEGKGIRYLLLHHGSRYWNFPKGRQEAGETELDTAKRELEEETGITQVKIIEGFKESYNYDFDSNIKGGHREKVYKTAIWFLVEVEDDQVKISDEHVDNGWFDYETAMKRSYFQTGQNLLKKANKFLLQEQGFVL